MKTYFLKPIMTPVTQPSAPACGKPAVPPKSPLPSPGIDPAKPRLCLGLDVHLEFIMAVAQRDHAGPQAPRRFTRGELVAHVRQLVAAGFQVFAVQELCGFGFVQASGLEMCSGHPRHSLRFLRAARAGWRR